jgi:hypothetical protein
MTSITGIELGPDCCVLVRTGRRGSRTTVAAARALISARSSNGLAAALRRVRRDEHFSARARVVAWGVAAADSATDPALVSELSPVVDAGFEIESILSPEQALARVVRARGIDTSLTAVAAVSLNTHGAAIAVVSRGVVITSRGFKWTLGTPFGGSRTELLDRYLLISQFAPQLQHLIELVRPVHGVRVSSIIVCGNLPNLRSLSMLLIEELDIEVETLDSADVLDANVAGFGESVTSLQLASAASLPDPPVVHVERQDKGVSAPTTVALFVLFALWSLLQISAASPAMPFLTAGDAAVVAMSPAPEPTSMPAPSPAPPIADIRPEATMGRIPAVPPLPLAPLEPAEPTPSRTAPARIRPALSDLPELPRVDGIMISGDRRLAIVGGNIVAPGDAVGPRVVVRIDRDGVVLRDPDGRQVYVAIRTRKQEPGGTDTWRQP